MKKNLHELLPAHISNEAAFYLVKFVHDLGLSLESIYFDHMVQYIGECEYDPFESAPEEDKPPF